MRVRMIYITIADKHTVTLARIAAPIPVAVKQLAIRKIMPGEKLRDDEQVITLPDTEPHQVENI